jgi:predicted ferric reductase
MLIVALSSWRRIRSRLAYETWFHLHVLGYAAVALAFGHVLVLGSDFVGNPIAQAWWWALYLLVAAMVLFGRVGPLLRSLVRPLRISSVELLPDGSRSVWVAGRSLPRMRARAGQYFQVRFGVPKLWWQSHPYSLSSAPFSQGLRFSFRAVGDDADAFARIRPGTRVWLQGPYGALDAQAGQGAPVVLIAGGTGIAPLRALLDDMTASQRPVVIMRCSDAQRAWFLDELGDMVAHRQGRLHVISGRRQWLARDPFGAEALTELIDDLPHRHAYVCGPTGMSRAAQRGLREAGMPARNIHTERYDY